MKKNISIIAALAIATSMVSSMGIFAADINQESADKTQGVQISKTYDAAYTVTIPASVAEDADIEISATATRLAYGKSLDVAIAENEDFALKYMDGAAVVDSVPYHLVDEDENVVTGSVINITTGTKTATLSVAPTKEGDYAETYTDTITFAVAIK